MLTLEQIRSELADRMTSKVAAATGLHPNTIRAIKNDPKANPTHQSLRALSDYLDRREAVNG